MLANCYEWHGIEHARYHEAVDHILGHKSAVIVASVQFVLFALVLVAYTITGASSIVQIASLSCIYAGKDPASAACFSSETGGLWKSALLFGAVQLFLGQIKNLEEGWWLSSMGTISSLVYSLLALGLAFSKAGNRLGSVDGIPIGMSVPSSESGYTTVSVADKAFGVLSSLGALAYAFSFALILIEVEDTLRQPPSAIISMKKSIYISASSAAGLFMAVGVTGYAAIGNGVTPIIFDSFSEPQWLVIIANMAVVLQMLASFQEFFQPLVNTLESHIKFRLLTKAIRKDAKVRRAEKEKNAAEAVASFDAEKGIKSSAASTSSISSKYNEPEIEYEHHVSLSKDLPGTPLIVDPTQPGVHPSISRLPSALVQNAKFRPMLNRCGTMARGQLNDQELLNLLSRTLAINNNGVDRLMSVDPQASRPHRKLIHDLGFIKNGIPLNEEGFMVPLYLRLPLRCGVTLVATLIAAIMPFFAAFISLIGSLTFFPLSIYFPIACYRKIKPVSKSLNRFLNALMGVMAVVCSAALVASVRSIAVSLSTYTIFGM